MPTRAQKCVADAVAQGKFSQALGGRVLVRLQQLLDKGLSETQAMQVAARDVIAAAAEAKRQAGLQVVVSARAAAAAASHPDGYAAGVRALLARDLADKAAYSNVESRARAVRGMAHAGLLEFLDRFRSRFLGLSRDRAGLAEFVRAVYGTSTDAELARMAKDWQQVTDRLLDRLIAAGAPAATRRADWRLPQLMDGARVRQAGQAEFTAAVNDAVQAGELRLRDYDTGLDLAPAARQALIAAAFERISTEGLSDLVPGAAAAGKLADRRAATRAFEWTSPEAWLKWNDRFGVGQAKLFDLFNGHIDGMAKDIAMLELLGPNPAATVRTLTDEAAKRAGPERAARARHGIDNLWAVVSGAAQTPVSESWANFGRELRAWLSAAQLGSATITGVSDLATLRQTAAWNGLPAVGALRRYLETLAPWNAEARRSAVRFGLLAEGWARRAAGAMRYQADSIGTGLGSHASEFVMRASGLDAHTFAGRWAFGMELLGHLGEQAGKRLDQLDPALRRGLERYGIGAAEWDLIRTHGLVQAQGVPMIFPEAVAQGGPLGGQAPAASAARARLEAATRLLEMAQSEGRIAIPEPGAAERALMLGDTRPGTLLGEFMRSTMQYKAFPVTMMTMHLRRGLNAARAGDFGGYLASLMVGMTVLGATALQAKQFLTGRDPRDMTSWKFWAAAWAQGGGAGMTSLRCSTW